MTGGRIPAPLDEFDDTAGQISGSRWSERDFLYVPGVEQDIPLYRPETDENVGHIKTPPQSYVVRPGSIHPSGNQYGPLEGDTIATVEEAEFREIFDPFIRESTSSSSRSRMAGRPRPPRVMEL